MKCRLDFAAFSEPPEDNTISYVLSADYQMAKNIPHWGKTPQPGSTFYKRKLSADSSVIVDYAREINVSPV